MKILIISPFIYPFATGGMEVYNFYFLRELMKLEKDVSLLSYHSGKIPLQIKQKKIYTRNPVIQSLQIFFHLISYRYDIVHIPYCSNSFLAYPLGFFRKFFSFNKYVIYIHGGGMEKWNSPKIHKFFFDNAKEILSVSDPIKSEYQKRTDKKITTILPLIPYDLQNRTRNQVRNELKIAEDEKLLIYVGSIKPIKGSDFLVDSFIKLGKDFLDKYKLKILFVGDGVLKNDLEEKVNQHRLNNYIIFIGQKPKEEVPDYLNSADIFINASHFEGTPLSILEAMYNKLLVVSTNVTGINNFITDKVNGLLFEKDDFNSFKNSIEFALVENEQRNKMITYAKEVTLKDYDYKKNILKHLEIYAR